MLDYKANLIEDIKAFIDPKQKYSCADNFWAKNNQHETVRLPLRIVDVDKGIVPVFKWLNSMSQTVTLWSCEGDALTYVSELGQFGTNYSYVMFLCRDPASLSEIRRVVYGFAKESPESEISLLEEQEDVKGLKNTTFNLWMNPNFLDDFIEYMEKQDGDESVGHPRSVVHTEDEGPV